MGEDTGVDWGNVEVLVGWGEGGAGFVVGGVEGGFEIWTETGQKLFVSLIHTQNTIYCQNVFKQTKTKISKTHQSSNLNPKINPLAPSPKIAKIPQTDKSKQNNKQVG